MYFEKAMGQNPFCLVYTFAAQNPVARFGHFYIFEFADPFVFAGEFHNDAACGATAEQTVFLVALFNEHTLRAAHHGSAALCGNLLLCLQKLREPLRFLLVRDRVFHFGGSRAGARRENKRKERRELHLADEAQRLAELLIRLARKADDNVGGQRQIGHFLFRIADEVKVFFSGENLHTWDHLPEGLESDMLSKGAWEYPFMKKFSLGFNVTF